jgi:hypothetical protein
MGQPTRLSQTNVLPFPRARFEEDDSSKLQESQGDDFRASALERSTGLALQPERASTGHLAKDHAWVRSSVIMMRLVILWLVLTGLFVSSASALEEAPRPDPNPVRSRPPTSDRNVPVPVKKPKISRDKFQADDGDLRIAVARAKCEKLLEDAVLDYQYLPPIRAGACGAKAPILVKSIGAEPSIVISPPAKMNCALAAALYAWFESAVQPAAKTMGTSVVKIRNAASYMCRRRYGATNTRISEHAFANALDISEFVFASGQRIKILGNWRYGARITSLPLAPTPPLRNPRRVAAMLALQDTAVAHETTGAMVRVSARRSIGSRILAVSKLSANLAFSPAPDTAQSPLAPLLQASMTPGSTRLARALIAPVESNLSISPVLSRGLTPTASEPANSNAEKAETKAPPEPTPPRILQRDEASIFIHVIHAEACRIFGTVLGPNANAAHKDHFHLDMTKRRYASVCK